MRRAAVFLVLVVLVPVVIVLALAAHSRSSAPAPAKPDIPTVRPATNGRVAVDGERAGEIYLVRAGEKARRLEVPGSAGASVACPAWSPDGTRLLFGRVTGSSQTGAAELVIVAVGSDGAIGAPKVIALDGFEVLPGFDAHPCGTWSPDGRWIASAGTGAVWVVDTQTGLIHRLPRLRPSDLEWRPGTGELAIAGDMGMGSGRPHALHADHHLLDGHRRAQPPRRRSRPRTSRGRQTARPWRTPAAKPTRESSGWSTATAPTNGCSSATSAARTTASAPCGPPPVIESPTSASSRAAERRMRSSS